MRRITGFIMIAIGAFFVLAIVRGVETLPGTQSRLAGAPFIGDGVSHPEYDGHLVIVCGRLTSDGCAYDDEMLLTLPTPCAVRYVEKLTPRIDEDGYNCLVWEPVRRVDESEWLREKVLYAGLSLGAYRVGDDLVQLLSPGKEVPLSMLDAQEVAELKRHNIYAVQSGGVSYFSEAPAGCFTDRVYDFYYEGARRIHYRMLDPGSVSTLAIAGIAEGDTLTRDDDLDTRPIFDGAASREDVVKQNGGNTVLGMVLVGLVSVILIAVGTIKLF